MARQSKRVGNQARPPAGYASRGASRAVLRDPRLHQVTGLLPRKATVWEGVELPQEELARLVGVRRETIGNLEKGRYNPSLVLAWNIAQVFGVSIEDVFTVEE